MTLWEVNEASTLVQEAAHEDANIIFGAVIDENMKPGELRVTVIATGLEGERAKIGERVQRREPAAEPVHVQRIGREPAPPPAPAARAEAPPAARQPEPAPAPAPLQRPAAVVPINEAAQADFQSPFEDEYDVPAFLRKRRAEPRSDKDEDERPAFIRRSAD
jgi:cell division protein FtsZ